MKVNIGAFFTLTSLCLTGCISAPPAPSQPPVDLSPVLEGLEYQEQQSQQYQAQLLEQQQQLDDIKKNISANFEQLEGINKQLVDLKKRQPAKTLPAKVLPAAPLTCPKPEKEFLTIENKHMLGRLEWLWLEQLEKPLKARIDTGAGTSSMSAINLVEIERDGKKYVRFDLDKDPDDDETKPITLTLPVVKYVRILQSSTKKSDRRPVVEVPASVGPITQTIEFTLTDRTHLNYPVLLGREFLQDIAVVDVSKKFIYRKGDR